MGGSGSGGGSTSGAVDYPAYMKTVHGVWLDNAGTDKIDVSVTDCMQAAYDNNPLTGLVAHDPSTQLTIVDAALAAFKLLADNMNDHTDYDAAIAAAASVIDTTVIPAAYIDAKVVAHGVGLLADYNAKIYPAFDAGMRDINAINTSAFVLGRANIATDMADKLDKFRSDLTLEAYGKRSDMITQAVSEMLRLKTQKIEFTRAWVAMVADVERLAIAAYGDEDTENKAIAVAEGKWPLEVWQYGANLLASIGGGTANPQKMEGNQMARIIGGGLSGAAAGALIGSRTGVEGGSTYGAILGGIAGMFGGA